MRTRTKTFTLVGIDADDDGVAAAQTVTPQVPLTLVGDPSVPAKISFTADGDLTGYQFGIFGTDSNGTPISDEIEGLSDTAPRETQKEFATITRITPRGPEGLTSTAQVTVGWAVGAHTPWIWTGRQDGHDQKPIAMCVAHEGAGVPTGNWEMTLDQFDTLPPEQVGVDDTVAYSDGNVESIAGEAVRFVLTSGAGTSVTVKITRSGL